MGIVTLATAVSLALAVAASQPALARYCAVGWAFPDAATVAIVVAGLVLGAPEGLVVGFIVGVVTATQCGHVGVGGIIVSRSAVGLLAGLASTRVYRANVLVQFGAGALGSLVADMVLVLFSPPAYTGEWIAQSLGKSLASGIIAPLLFVIVVRVARWETGEGYLRPPSVRM